MTPSTRTIRQSRNRRSILLAVSLAAVLVLSYLPTSIQGISNPLSSKHRPWKFVDDTATRDGSSITSSRSSWSSYVTVDPSTMVSLLVKHAGFLLDPELQKMASVFHCDHARLHVVNKQLEVTNLRIIAPNQTMPALQIGRLVVKWESYRRPCVSIELENVDILVEFTNLLLTKTNWQELRQAGFPPHELVYYYTDNVPEEESTKTAATKAPTSTTTTTSDKIRIGSLELKGKVTLRTKSRPLQVPVADDAVLSLEALKELNAKIEQKSQRNLVTTQRKGCTSEEVSTIVEKFFKTKLKEIVKHTMEDLAADPKASRLAKGSQKAVDTAKTSLLSYASNLQRWSQDNIKNKVGPIAVQGEDEEEPTVLLTKEEMEEMVTTGLDTLQTSLLSMGSRAKEQMKEAWKAAKEKKDAAAAGTEAASAVKEKKIDDDHVQVVLVQDEEIIFPDW